MISEKVLNRISDTAIWVGIVATLATSIFPHISLYAFGIACFSGILVTLAYFARLKFGFTDEQTQLHNVNELDAVRVVRRPDNEDAKSDVELFEVKTSANQDFVTELAAKFRAAVADQERLREQYRAYLEQAIAKVAQGQESTYERFVATKRKTIRREKIVHKDVTYWLEATKPQ